ncbi:hypothetical protein BTA51_11380 [Hahella sp. CCB-MM4]|uniref:hypothetical protein n=1 Tax=Hahella sp. (strain CCB-MM4) TaxID=1926491 RepID=UPI000B9ADF4A|nr:hypothetical protein [Hahella sp. CCB-MM4]OZG73092.1 hypothetical protein BTA51_11380 [Hahella sp. CCB-MM4]
MTKKSHALTLAEGDPDFKTNATLILGGNVERGYVLRTAYDSLAVWKAKYAIGVSPFYPKVKTTLKDAALIDNEIWVFGVDATVAQHIVDAVSIGAQFYKVEPSEIMRHIYVKNLNAERENGMETKALIKANMSLYEKTAIAINEAASILGIKGKLDFYIYSASKNHKIPRDNLSEAVSRGGGRNFTSDSRIHKFFVGSNNGLRFDEFLTNMHKTELNW